MSSGAGARPGARHRIVDCRERPARRTRGDRRRTPADLPVRDRPCRRPRGQAHGRARPAPRRPHCRAAAELLAVRRPAPGCLRVGVIPVMALPAHRRHELAYLVDHSEAAAIAVPGDVRDFNHQQLAENLVADCPTLRVVLTTSEIVRAASTDLTALCAEPPDAAAARRRWDADPPGSRDVALFLLSGGTTGLPKLIAHPRRLRLQRPRQRRAVRAPAGYGVPGDAARLAQLPAGLPRHPRHHAGRRPHRHAALTGAGAGLRRHRRRGRHRHRCRSRGRAALDPARQRVRRRPAAHP